MVMFQRSGYDTTDCLELFWCMSQYECECQVRYAGSLESSPEKSYQIVLFGQIIAAIGQPLILNSPPRIANDWFPIYERDLAIHVMTQANNVGGALG